MDASLEQKPSTFNDKNGTTWTVEITLQTVRELKRDLDVDLLDVSNHEMFERLQTDAIVLIDCLYVVCREQANARNITDEGFGRLFSGDSIDNATKAFMDALVFFTPNQVDRKNLRTLLDHANAATDKIRAAQSEAIDSGAIERQINEHTEKAIVDWRGGLRSTKPQESSAS